MPAGQKTRASISHHVVDAKASEAADWPSNIPSQVWRSLPPREKLGMDWRAEGRMSFKQPSRKLKKKFSEPVNTEKAAVKLVGAEFRSYEDLALRKIRQVAERARLENQMREEDEKSWLMTVSKLGAQWGVLRPHDSAMFNIFQIFMVLQQIDTWIGKHFSACT